MVWFVEFSRSVQYSEHAGQYDKQQWQGDNEAADYRNCQRLMELCPCADTQRQRHQSNDCAQRGHQFWPEPRRNGINDRFVNHLPYIFRVLLDVFQCTLFKLQESENGIFPDDAHDHDQAGIAAHV